VYSDFETAKWSLDDIWNREDPDFPFYEKDCYDDLKEEDVKDGSEWVVFRVVGEYALGGVTIRYENDETILKELWNEEEEDWDHYL
jgi:hypothetical protein